MFSSSLHRPKMRLNEFTHTHIIYIYIYIYIYILESASLALKVIKSRISF